jgi:glycosyltransferase involved in cell wall biosynthesis
VSGGDAGLTPPPVRLLILCGGDPEGARPFSGSARNLFRALEALGCVHHKANVYGLLDPFAWGSPPVRLLRRLDRAELEEHYQWSRLHWARNAARARRVAAAHPGYNACLMYGTTCVPPLAVPTYSYLDATVAQVAAAGGWEFARFSAAKRRRILAFQRRVFQASTAVLPRTAWAASSVVADYGLPPERVTVVGAGANHAAEPPPHGPYDTRTILFVGIDFERKGGPLLVEAFRRVRARIPDARLRIVGCTPAVDVPGVEVIGPISKDAPGGLARLLALYSEASVFCMMSHFEPFGIVMVEAQQAGVPCVAPDRFAFPEIVVDGETGRLTRGYDAGELAQVLCEMLTDPAGLARMGAAARARAAREWTWARAAERIHARVRADLARRAAP